MNSKFKTWALLSLALAAAVSMSCQSSRLDPPGSGSIFASTKVNHNCQSSAVSGGFSGGGSFGDANCVGNAGPRAVGSKSGEACASSILGLIQTGDMSMKAAAENGGLKTVSSVDASHMHVLGLYQKNCIIVNGD